MTVLIDGYIGKYNNIDYKWKKQGEYALFSFSIEGQNVEKRIGKVTGKPLEEEMIKMISGMEIDHSLTRLENDKVMSDIMAGIKS